MRLSPPQLRMLRAMLASGESEAPWGFPSAGRAASAWYRTSAALVRAGLAEHYRLRDSKHPEYGKLMGFIRITPAGRLAAGPP